MPTREELQQTSERAREQVQTKLSSTARTLTFRVELLLEAASKIGRTNVVVHRYTGRRATEPGGVAREVHDWCVAEYSDLTVKDVSLGHDWVDAHHCEIFGIVVDWSKPGEEQQPYVPPYTQIHY